MVFSPKMETDILLMQEALAEARASASAGEVPIGAILVHDGKILARSGNRTIRDNDPTAHAEIIVLREAARLLSNYRSRTQRSTSPSSPAACAPARSFRPASRASSTAPTTPRRRRPLLLRNLSNPRLNHEVEVSSGILAAEAAAVLQSFFAARR